MFIARLAASRLKPAWAAARLFIVVALLFTTAGCSNQQSALTSPAAGSPLAAVGTPDASASPTAAAIASGVASASPTPAPTASATATPEVPDEDDEPGVAPSEPPGPATGGGGGDVTIPAGRLPGEPDPKLTPGALNLAVTQATIGSTICVSGWTATVRPPSSYTTNLKIQQIGLYGYTDTATASYEEDHLIPLELGGAPSDAKNLWPQPWYEYLPDGRPSGARTKDSYENTLKKAVCAGSMTLAAAQSAIGIHWVHSYYTITLPVAAPTAVAPTGAPPPQPTAPKPIPTIAPTAASRAGCDPSYPTVCIPPPPPDLNCADIPYRRFTVLQPDPHHFDGDKDGIGCES